MGKTRSGNEMGVVGCTGQRRCSSVPHVQVEKVEGGLLVAGVQVASSCQVALPVSGLVFLIIGTTLTVIAYQGQSSEEDYAAYTERVNNSSNSRLLGPVCLGIALFMLLAGLFICLLAKYARSKDQRVCFHCPVHGDFFPKTPVPVSAVRGHKSKLFCLNRHSAMPPEPPMCPYSNLLTVCNSMTSSSCPTPKPFIINNSLRCVEYFWPLTMTQDIASFPVSRPSSPTPVNQVTEVENGLQGPVICTTLPEVKMVAPAADRGSSADTGILKVKDSVPDVNQTLRYSSPKSEPM